MLKRQSSILTRPQRKAIYAICMWLMLLGLAIVMTFGSGSHTWVSTAPGVGTMTRKYGWAAFLTIEETLTPPTGPSMPGTITTWTWHPFGLVIQAFILLVAGILCRIGFVRLMKNERLPPHLCDECGYNLTGVAHDKCPECGAARN